MKIPRALIFGLGVLLMHSPRSAPAAPPAPPPSSYKMKIAVVDGRDLAPAPNPKMKYLSRIYRLGLSEILSIDLRKVDSFLVIDRELIKEKLAKLGKTKSLEKASKILGLELGADCVVQPQFRFLDKDYVELTLAMVHTREGAVKSLKTATGPQKDLFKMLDDFVLAVAAANERTLAPETVKAIKKQTDVSLEAWHRFTRAMEFYYQKNQNSLILALEQLRKAENKDILFLPTYIAQAKIYLEQAKRKWGNGKNLYDKAREAARKALFIDSKYLDGYEIIAEVYFLRGDYVTSVRESLKAIRLNPNSLKSRALLVRSYLAMGKREEASREIEKMLELDPANEEALKLRQASAR